ncbi:SDR family oxidoreductase [Neotamlana laminarinivorans]|uniref:SDR family oxidoreductase n=1 Tax=Neotamlana laminarinivorans TaxID=2883124 RepID=A0A9X1I2P4_9FLAO|nr:SDR family oxidoreductase [Tamlana laminarinivorans]MCB4799207.1 SDR family oxidoreductase [Tamlana laminarinivorans]
MNTLKNKTALITGGSKGIGYATALALLNEGINVAVTSRSKAAADNAVAELNKTKTTDAEAIGVEADVRSFESQENAVKEILERFKQIDIVVANAGLGHFASIEDLTLEQWHDIIDTNLTGVFYSIKTTVEALKQTQGYFISISSLAGTNFFAKGSAYNASKFGVTGFTQAVMLDLRQHNVKVSTIMPGSVSTYFNGRTPSEDEAWKIQGEDIGELVVDLLKMNPRTLPSKIEVRPTMPPQK